MHGANLNIRKKYLSLLGMIIMAGFAACSGSDGEDDLMKEENVPVSLRIGYPVQTRIIAHRGYWNTAGSAENSLAALDKAAEAGFYGSEFDVRLTSDGVPVISHDERIHDLPIEALPYSRIMNITLKNGERIPTLRQYLNRGKEKDIQLILEIKTDDIRAAALVVSMVGEMNMQQQVEYISFSVPMCLELLRLSPGSSVSFLGGSIPPDKLKKMGFTGLDYYHEELTRNPEWIREAQELGMTVNVWIVNDMQMMNSFVRQNVDFITTDKPGTLQQMIAPY